MTNLSIIIPTLDESKNLPLLLSDLSGIDYDHQIIVIDAKSKNISKEISRVYGAKYFLVKKKNRGFQLNYGAKKAKGEWLLFLHADSRLNSNWFAEVKTVIQKNPKIIYFFRFKIRNKEFRFRFLELLVNLRSIFLKTPYGDQGLLINKKTFIINKRYSEIPIMEDIDFIRRLKNKTKLLLPLKTSIYTSARKWKNKSILIQSIRNWRYRKRWLKGESIEQIYLDYYKSKT